MKRTTDRRAGAIGAGIRCFLAVELPSEMREAVELVQREFQVPGVKVVRPELVHITLKFLGDVPLSKVEAVVDALRTVRVDPFRATIGGLGAFPGRSIRVIWLGAQGNFSELHGEVEGALRPFGFKREHGFTPHATLGRVRQPTREMSDLLASRMDGLGEVQMGEYLVDRFLLKKSTLTPGGPIYEDLAEFPL